MFSYKVKIPKSSIWGSQSCVALRCSMWEKWTCKTFIIQSTPNMDEVKKWWQNKLINIIGHEIKAIRHYPLLAMNGCNESKTDCWLHEWNEWWKMMRSIKKPALQRLASILFWKLIFMYRRRRWHETWDMKQASVCAYDIYSHLHYLARNELLLLLIIL